MDLLFRLSVVYFGYLHPAYKCYSAMASSKTKIEQLQTWCRYWIIIAIFTSVERVADALISWIPFYSESKLVFVVYLWHADMKGTDHIYEKYIIPFFTHQQPVDGADLSTLLTEILKFLSSKTLLAMQMKLNEALQQFNLTSLNFPFYQPASVLTTGSQSQPENILPFQTAKPSTPDSQPQADQTNGKGYQQPMNANKEPSDFEMLHSSNIPSSVSHTGDSTSIRHRLRWRKPHR